MEEGVVRMEASMWALVAEMNAELAWVEAMKAFNSYRADRGEVQGYCEQSFYESSQKIHKIAGRLRDEI